MISFIVPAYNVENYINKCLESLIPFIERGDEVVVVNDGSTDKTPEIISDFEERYPQIKVINQNNKGLSGARNTGLRFATKEYVWFVDSDDFIDFEDSKILFPYLDGVNDLIAFGRKEVFKKKITEVPKLENQDFESGLEYFENAMRNGYYRTNVWDKIYRREVIMDKNIRFVEGLLYEDMFFNLQFQSYAEKTICVSTYPYNYIKFNTESISAKVKLKDLDVLKFIELANDFTHDSNLNNPKFINAFNQLIFNWVSSCLLNKYVALSTSDKDANHIVDETLHNKIFMEAANFCAHEKVRIRYKIFAKLLLFSPYIYKLVLMGALKISHLR